MGTMFLSRQGGVRYGVRQIENEKREKFGKEKSLESGGGGGGGGRD